MSILDTTRENRTLIDHEVDHKVARNEAPTRTTSTSPSRVTRQERPRHVSRFFAALRPRGFSARDRALLAEPAIYQEYRASLARQEMAREMSRRS